MLSVTASLFTLYTDINYRRCHCPKWIQGTLPNGHLVRESAKTRSWEKAEIDARAMEDIADPYKPTVRERITIEDAIQCFRDNEKSRIFFFGKQLKTSAEEPRFS
jgi:integrase/recombinase XerD